MSGPNDVWAMRCPVSECAHSPGKPTDNGFIEAFYSKLRSECLNAHWFMTLADAMENWRIGPSRPIAMQSPAGQRKLLQ